MTSALPPTGASASPRRRIIDTVSAFLHANPVRRLYVADATLAPPMLAYVTPFPRLSVVLRGVHLMEIASPAGARMIRLRAGEAIFIPAHAWNKPDWETPGAVLTVLLSARQLGVSLVRHDGADPGTGDGAPAMSVAKSSMHSAYDGPVQHLLRALVGAVSDRPRGTIRTTAGNRLPVLLTETLLHASLQQLSRSGTNAPRKAVRTYEAACLYIQEHYQQPLTRDMVAHHLGLAPTHVSRLFRREGLMRFNDYVNLVRVNQAKFLLRTYRMPLKEIAAHCGYSDVTYFCQLFKQMSSMTPTQYRNAMKTPVHGLTREDTPAG